MTSDKDRLMLRDHCYVSHSCRLGSVTWCKLILKGVEVLLGETTCRSRKDLSNISGTTQPNIRGHWIPNLLKSRELSFPDWPSNWLQLGALSRARWTHNLPTNLLRSWAPTRAHWPFNLLHSGALIRAQWVPHQPTNFLHLGDVFRAHWLLQSTSKLLAYRSCCQRSLTYKSLSQNTEPSQNTTHWPLRCRNSIKCLLER